MISDACDRLRDAGADVAEVEWIDNAVAADIGFSGDLATGRAALDPLMEQIDIVVQTGVSRQKSLIVSDMDSTMITVECIDELADYAGIKPQIAAITERAMQGELDFAAALQERVALLAGLDESVIARCLNERVRPMPGAITLVRTMAGWGAHGILVSGGFTAFAGPVAGLIGFQEFHANLLAVEEGRLTGGLAGDIVDAAAKRSIMTNAADALGLSRDRIMAVGDGANDLPMIEAVMAGGGLGIAYHAKPLVAAAAGAAIRHGDLTALLYAQGIARAKWVS